MSRRAGTLAGAGLITLGAGAFGALVNLVVALLVARHLGATGAGVYFAVVAVATIAANVAELGVDTALVRFIAAARAGRELEIVRAWIRAIRVPLLVSTATVVAGGVAVAASGVVPAGGWALVGCAVAAACLTVTAVALSVTRGFGDSLTYPVVMSLLVPGLRLGGVGAVVLVAGGVSSMVAAWAAPLLVAVVVAVLLARRRLRAELGPLDDRGVGDRPDDADQVRRFWRFSSARGVGAGIEIAIEWIDVVLVSLLAGPATAGIYAVVTRIVRASEIVQQAARIVIAPIISAAFARRDLTTVSTLQALVASAMVWLAWPFFTVMVTFGDVILGLFGPGFVAGWSALAVLSVAVAVQIAAGPLQSIVLMAGHSRWQVQNKGLALVVMVVLDVVLIPEFGALGAAVAWSIALVVETSVALAQVFGRLAIPRRWREPVLAAATSTVTAAVISVATRWTVGPNMAGVMLAVVASAVALVGLGWLMRQRLQWSALASIAADGR